MTARKRFSAVWRQSACRPWFQRHGALVQELIPPVGHDLRLVVAAGVVIGATRRIAAPGEWRTNVSLGATRSPTRPTAAACALGIAAAAAINADLVGIDLLPTEEGYSVIELNGAVDFDASYALPGHDVFRDAADALGLLPVDAGPKPLRPGAEGRYPVVGAEARWAR